MLLKGSSTFKNESATLDRGGGRFEIWRAGLEGLFIPPVLITIMKAVAVP